MLPMGLNTVIALTTLIAFKRWETFADNDLCASLLLIESLVVFCGIF